MSAGSIFIGASAALIISVSTSFRKEPEPATQHHDPAEDYENEHHIVNWSETHECRPKRFYQPETHEELEALVAEAHAKGAPYVLKHVSSSCDLSCLLVAAKSFGASSAHYLQCHACQALECTGFDSESRSCPCYLLSSVCFVTETCPIVLSSC